MKKKLIGFSVCMMLVAISFIPNITADEKTESILSLSEEEYNELNEKLLKLNDQLLAATTVDQVENVIRSVVVFLDDYGLLAEDTTVDEEVALLKNAYIEQIQCQPGETIAGETTIQEGCIGSEITMGQPLSMSYGWLVLIPYPWPFHWGYKIIGRATNEETFISKNFNQKLVSGYVSRSILMKESKLHDDNGDEIELSFVRTYLVFGFGVFDLTCKYSYKGEWQEKMVGRAHVRGLKVRWEAAGMSAGYLDSEQQQIQGQQSSEQLIGATQQYVTGSTTNN